MQRFIFALSLSLALLVSPEAQVILGNSAGFAGPCLYPVFVVLAGVAFLTIKAYSHAGQGEFTLLRDRYGLWLPLTSLLASRVVFFVTASTIVLVTSGYVFNEVFLSSFPNFGFAFLLLGVICLLNLLSPKVARLLQIVLIALWLTGLVYLIFNGVFAENNPRATGEFTFSAKGLVLPFLLLVGVELAFVGGQDTPSRIPLSRLWWGFVLVYVLLMLWALVMGKMVSPDLLSQSYIPHTKTASRLLGDPGRMALGVSMIAGTCALVNGLILGLVCQVKDVCLSLSSSRPFIRSKWFRVVVVLILSSSPAIMMLKGMAGYDITEVYLRGGLLFWLLHYAFVHAAVTSRGSQLYAFLHGFVVLLLVGVGAGLVYFDEDILGLSRALLFIFLSSGVFSAIIYFFCRTSGQEKCV